MVMRYTYLLACLALAACATAKENPLYANLPPLPAPLGSVIRTARTQIPLPPGNWVELARSTTPRPAGVPGSASDVQYTQISLGLIEGGAINVYLFAATNTASALRGFPASPACTQIAPGEAARVFLQDQNGYAQNNSDCMRVQYVKIAPPAGEGFLADTWAAARKYGGMPADAIDVFVNANYFGNTITYSMHYFPERDGARVGAWASGAEDAGQKAYVASLVRWAKGFRHWIVEGTKGQL